jgi:hypothetical protein
VSFKLRRHGRPTSWKPCAVSQLSTTTRYAHLSPQRMIATATAAARAWDLMPDADGQDGG